MTDFGNLLGTLLASLAHARRITDEETAVIAEYYKDSPLLSGMSVPRIRVPELNIELPMLIKSVVEGKKPVVEEAPVITGSVVQELQSMFNKFDLHLDPKLRKELKKEIQNDLEKLGASPQENLNIQREHISRIVDEAFARSVEKFELKNQIPQTNINQIAQQLRNTARDVAFRTPPEPPSIDASIITAEVKEQASAGNVVRLQLSMKEEGLEWDIINYPDGTTTSSLSPE